MILVYYNPSKDTFYFKYYRYINGNYFIGYKNQFDHEVVKIYIVRDKELKSVNSIEEYKCNISQNRQRKEKLKTRVIDGAIRLLNKFK